MTQSCETCRYWCRDPGLTRPLDPGVCAVLTARPFWLQRCRPPTYAHEGTYCDAWAERKLQKNHKP
jgi:hypothetical protein